MKLTDKVKERIEELEKELKDLKESLKEPKYWVPEVGFSGLVFGEYTNPNDGTVLKGYCIFRDYTQTSFATLEGSVEECDEIIFYSDFRAPIPTPENCHIKIGSLCKFWDDDPNDFHIGFFNGFNHGKFNRVSSVMTIGRITSEVGIDHKNMLPIKEALTDGVSAV